MTTLEQLLAPLSVIRLLNIYRARDNRVARVTADSREVGPDTLFVAIKGAQHDGHRYLPTAAENGAVAAIGVLSPQELMAVGIRLPNNYPYVQVADSRTALAFCSAALNGFPSRKMTVVGVTGTDGKTTTSTLLESILSAATRPATGRVGRVGVITTVGARIGGVESDTGFHVTTPDAPAVQGYLSQMSAAGCVFAIVESTSHGLAQDRVAAVDFDVAAVTNITHEHLDYHGHRDAYVAAKARLFRLLYATQPKVGIERCAILNADDDGSFEALRAVMGEEAQRHGVAIPIRSYATAAERAGEVTTSGTLPDVVAHDIVYQPSQTRFTLEWWGGKFDVSTPLIGDFNVSNVLCAATVALVLGIEPSHIQSGIEEMEGVLGRMERIDRGQPFLAVVDFAHSPVSLERALLTLRPLVSMGYAGRAGRLIAVFGCAGLRDREKRGLMGQVSGRLADFTVLTAEDPRTEDLAAINQAIVTGVRRFAGEDTFTIIPDRTQAIQFAIDMAEPGDVVAAFGKGHERTICFGTTEYPWSDQDAMTNALEARYGHP